MSYPANSPRIPTTPPLTLPTAVTGTLRRSPGMTSLFIFAGLAHAGAHGAVAWCAALLGRSLVAQGTTPAHHPWISPVTIAAAGLGAVVLKAVAGTLATLAQSRLSADTARSLQDHTVAAILQTGLLARSPLAIARLSSRIRELERAIQDGLLTLVRAAAQLVPIAAALWLLAPSLTLIAALVLAPFAAGLSWARKRLRKRHAEWMRASDSLYGELDDLVRHADLWRTYGTGRHIQRIVHDLGTQAALARSRSDTLATALSSLNEVLAALALVLAVAAASRWFPGSAPNLVAFAAVFFMAYRPIRDLGDGRAALVRGQEALDALREIARPEAAAPQRPQESSTPDEARCPDFLQPLAVHDLRVDGRLPPVSFELPPGRLVAVAGATGAGKSTLLRALLGLEPEARGELRFGTRSLLHTSVGPAARPFAWVPQDAPIISGSLEDNFHVAGVDRESGLAGLALVGASDLTDGIASVKLGANGRDLSGGERRWIALARALATRLPVVLLDEPTVGLDPESKQRVIDALIRLRGQRSLLCVSHDPDVLRVADQVVRLPD